MAYPTGMDVRRRKLWFRRLAKAVALIVGLPLFYLAAALAGALIPANSGWSEPTQGVPIFVRTNGVHTWLVVPKQAVGIDWRGVVDARDIADRRYAAGDYLAFGFGNRDFYLNTPTWADLKVSTALAAAFGRGPALMHVDHVWNPRPDADQRRIVLRPDEYRRLAALIRASFARDAAGNSIVLKGKGYGPSDAFYEAVGNYNGARTCNEWTGELLRKAGVRTGVWTPFSDSIMWRLREVQAVPS